MPEEIRQRHELVEGELIKLSSPALRHNNTRDRLLRELAGFLERTPGIAIFATDVVTVSDSIRRLTLASSWI